MSWRKIAIGVSAAFLASASALAADFGVAPSGYEAAVEDYFSERLEDPRAARIQVTSEPYQVFADMQGYEGLPCWAVDVRVKARMPGGGFGGFVPYTVIFMDGEAVALEADTIRMVKA